LLALVQETKGAASTRAKLAMLNSDVVRIVVFLFDSLRSAVEIAASSCCEVSGRLLQDWLSDLLPKT
jgi:hypothetical protein